ncbi:MAG TPA: hypothetical protein VLK65_29995 [Vicinamibacteria bacterium]|nr:hypothetical protein [Vicinamibacteria bacterium]
MWAHADWDRALLSWRETRMNFLKFYPQLEPVMARVFPAAVTRERDGTAL